MFRFFFKLCFRPLCVVPGIFFVSLEVSLFPFFVCLRMWHRTLVVTTILAPRWTTWGRLDRARFSRWRDRRVPHTLLISCWSTYTKPGSYWLVRSTSLHWDNKRCVANRSWTPRPLLRHLTHRPTSHIDLAPLTVVNIFTLSAKITTSTVKLRSACLSRLWFKHTASEGARRRSGLSCVVVTLGKMIVSPLWVIPKLAGLSSPSSYAASRVAECTVSRCRSV